MPGIDQTPGWDRLLATLDRAHTDGYDVSRLLERSLSAKQPIDVRDAVENLRYHVLGSIDPEPHEAPAYVNHPLSGSDERRHHPEPPRTPSRSRAPSR